MSTESPPTARGVWPKAVTLLVLAGLLAYANSFTKAFVLDDSLWIVNNPDIADASRYVTWGDRPVIKATIWLNYKFGKLNPPGYHAVNFAIHILAGLTLYGLVRRVLLLTRFAGHYDNTAPYLAFAVALLWVVHPLQTMSVTYVIQRAESMMGLFYLFAFYAWVRGATGGRWGWYAAALASFSLSNGCKQVAVTLPVVLLVFDRVFLAQSWRELCRQRWQPFLGLFLLWAVLSVGPAVTGAFSTDVTTGVGFGIAITPVQYLLTESEVILHYLRLSVLPLRQAIDYIDWPIAKSFGDVWQAFLVVSAMLAGTFVLLYLRPAAGFVAFWFFAILAPTSSIMPLVDPAFEQRMYLPLISVIVGLVFGVHALIARASWTDSAKTTVGVVALSVAATLLTGLTFIRNETFRSEMVTWETASRVRPNNPRPWLALAALSINAGDLPRAAETINTADRIDSPYRFPLQVQQAAWLSMAGQLPQAEALYAALAGLDYNPFASPRVYRNLAWVLLARGKPDEAAAILRKLIEKQPQVAENHLSLAAVELAAGHQQQAHAAAAEAVRLNPVYPRQAAALARASVLIPEGPSVAFRKPQSLWLAAAACLADEDRDPQMLDTLAMAYAWNEKLPQAADATRRGIATAKLKGEADWVTALEARLKLYEAGKPYAKPAQQPPAK